MREGLCERKKVATCPLSCIPTHSSLALPGMRLQELTGQAFRTAGQTSEVRHANLAEIVTQKECREKQHTRAETRSTKPQEQRRRRRRATGIAPNRKEGMPRTGKTRDKTKEERKQKQDFAAKGRRMKAKGQMQKKKRKKGERKKQNSWGSWSTD